MIPLLGNLCAAFALLVLPGYALLRYSIPARRLGFLSRLTISPGITIAGAVLLFTWADVFALKLWPITSWLLVAGSLLSLFFPWRFRIRPRRRVPPDRWLAGATLAVLLLLFLIVRFHSTWAWAAPPGIDSAQHALIVQLLLDHRGLFQSWAPYSDAQTFTYHFGFHAITALFVWMTGVDVPQAVLIMARLVGVCAIASLFALVRLWTRSAWGGVFAVAFWELYSRHLYFFDLPGRWTLLTGLAILPAALVLLDCFLQSFQTTKIWKAGLLTGAVAGGLVLSQYKTALIFALLAATLVCSRFVAALFSKQRHLLLQIASRATLVSLVALLLTAPRLKQVFHARTGQRLQRIVLQAPPANPAAFGAPQLNAIGILRTALNTPQKIAASILALVGAIVITRWRRQAIWFGAGWLLVSLTMNPRLIGLERTGLIDEIHWKFAVQTAVAALAGLVVGLICEPFVRRRSLPANVLLSATALGLALWGAARLPPLPQSSRYLLPDDVRLVGWIKAHLPPQDLIAARSFFDQREVQGMDAAIWIPLLTRHQTNQTNLAAGLEKGRVGRREKFRVFTRELYGRDMSLPESARWMREQGFHWFFAGATLVDTDKKLLDSIGRNPAIRVTRVEGAARLYHID